MGTIPGREVEAIEGADAERSMVEGTVVAGCKWCVVSHER